MQNTEHFLRLAVILYYLMGRFNERARLTLGVPFFSSGGILS